MWERVRRTGLKQKLTLLRVLAAAMALIWAIAVSGCTSKADAGQNVEANKADAANAGVANAGTNKRTSKPPFDPTK